MDPSVVSRTQQTLGKVIKKPPLSEKYLNKPPFRFLHDIFTEVIRTTGFMKGLFTETELKSDNIKEKEAKMAFLQKAIDLVVMVTAEPLSVKPARVVSGHEPEKTNALLQAIALCCINKVSSDDAVRRLLSGDKQGPQSREEGPRGAEVKGKKTKSEEPKEEPTERQKNKDSEQRHRERREKEKREERKEEKGDKKEERRDGKERREKRSEERDKTKDKHREKERERKTKTRIRPAEDPPQPQVKSEAAPQKISPEEPAPALESSARLPRPSSAKGQRRRATVGSQDESDSDAEVVQKVPEASAEATEAAPRRMVRPSSARPAPPRVKKQEPEPTAERSSSAKVSSLILDSKRPEEEENDEDQQFLVQEVTTTEAPDAITMSTEAEDDPTTHGGLVKNIMETKRYYEVSPSKAQVPLMSRQDPVDRDLVQRDMQRLRSAVQSVCRSTLPLGKIMDYIQEDVDCMRTELSQWKEENMQHARALEEERRLTEGALLPLRSELLELDSLIQDQQTQICVLRCSVLKNEEKIHKMLRGLQHHS